MTFTSCRPSDEAKRNQPIQKSEKEMAQIVWDQLESTITTSAWAESTVMMRGWANTHPLEKASSGPRS